MDGRRQCRGVGRAEDEGKDQEDVMKTRNDFSQPSAQNVTVKKKGHTGQPLHRPDEQLHQRLPATLWLGLVDLQNDRA